MKRTDSSSKKNPGKNAPLAAPDTAPSTDADRARAIVASLRNGEPSSDEMFEAFWQLDSLPVNDVREALKAWVGPLPDIDRLDPATRRAHGFPLPALRLRTLSVARDADLLDLGPVAEEQLRIAGTTWDGADLAPEDRLDGELEGSLAGTIERRVLAEAKGAGVATTDETPLFDVLLYGEDSGVVFASGTKNVVALIAYGKVETRDRRVRAALQEAIATPEVAAPVASVAAPIAIASEAEAPATKAAPKKAVIEKTGTKKAGATKGVPAKKIAAKKQASTKPATKPATVKKAQKPIAKNAIAKNAIAKNAIAKTEASKKPVAKKAVTKKSVTKQPVTKKPVAKKPVIAKAAPKKQASTRPAAKKQGAKKAAKKAGRR